MRVRRRWIGPGLLVALSLAVGANAWRGRTTWPALVAFPPDRSRQPLGFAPDGRTYWSWSREEGGTTARDVATGAVVRADPILAKLALSADGRAGVGVAGGDGGEVVVIDAASGAIRRRLPVLPDEVGRLAFADGDRSVRAFLINGEYIPTEMITWDLATGAQTGQPFRGHTNPTWSRVPPRDFADDGSVAVYLFDRVELWDAVAGRSLGVLDRPLIEPGMASLTTALLTRDGRRLVIGRLDGFVEVWDVPGRRLLRTINAHRGDMVTHREALAPDGRLLLSTGMFVKTGTDVVRLLASGWVPRQAQEAVIVDLATGAVLGRSSGTGRAEFSPDGRLVATQEWDATLSLRATPRPADR